LRSIVITVQRVTVATFLWSSMRTLVSYCVPLRGGSYFRVDVRCALQAVEMGSGVRGNGYVNIGRRASYGKRE
jgi:hypothetical protein